MGLNEQKYVQDAFDTNWIAPLGPNVTEFENTISDYFKGGLQTAALSSGTGALHLALKMLGVGAEDEVVCQSFTFAASANPIVYLGATPIFVDSEDETWNICPVLLEEAIQDRLQKTDKLPKAIIAVDLYGMPYQIDKVDSVAKKYGIPVIEDSAEALGSEWNGEKCGSFGECGILSFNGNKIITTSGGGALVSKNKELIDKAIFLATQARDKAVHYQHSTIGFNYRMSNVLAGIGRGQMEVLSQRVNSRRSNFEFYKKSLSDIPEIKLLEEPKGYKSNRWLTTILTDSYVTRERIRESLLGHRIESRPLWKPLHLQPCFEDVPSYLNGKSEIFFQRGLCLPSGSSLTQNQLEEICELIRKEF